MTVNRRQFLKASTLAGSALALGGAGDFLSGSGSAPRSSHPRVGLSSAATPSHGPAPRSLDILILGGTSFLGPHQVRFALERGHNVSIFTRGRTEPELFQAAFQDVEHLIGDRAGDLDALRGRSWDGVIDNSGARVEWTRDSAQLLKDRCGTYLYVSSTGVYYPYLTTDITEDGPVKLVDESRGENGSAAYGVMKANSELEARKAFQDRTLVVRPGYIAGPGDRSDRFTYWPVRIHRGGEILVPGKMEDRVQFIDVRDLTEWMIRSLEVDRSGVFNATGPEHPLTMAEFIYGVRAVTTSEVHWSWVEDYEFLKSRSLLYAIPWIMPVDDELGSLRIDVSKAASNGLTFRTLAETARDTLDWWYSESVSPERRGEARFVLDPVEEMEILEAWPDRIRGADRRKSGPGGSIPAPFLP